MTNSKVIEAWCNSRKAESSSMSTDGEHLFSYKLEIARVVDGQPIIWNYTSDGVFVSRTTSKHVGLARKATPSADVMCPSKKH